MQEQKNKLLMILLVVLIGATSITLWLGKRDDISTDKNLFNDYDLNSVNEVKLESSASSVKLSYTGSRWNVNEKFSADPSMIEVLFATLLQAVPKRPVGSLQEDSVKVDLRENGIKVSILSAGSVLQTFYAGGNNAKTQAYFMSESEEVPYVMNIPGYRVYVSGIFELKESGWREKRIFSFNWRNFKELDARFPSRPEDNFRVALKDQFFTIQGMQAVDTTKLNDFLDAVSLLGAEEFVGSTADLDSLAKVSPVVKLAVQDIAGRSYKLDLYTPTDKRGQIPGLLTDGQWALFSSERVAPILRPRKFFENKR